MMVIDRPRHRRLRVTAALLAAAALAACTEPPPVDDQPLPPPPQCAPTAGGPYQLVEGETVTFTITCANPGEVRSGDRFILSDLPDGAVYDPATATVTWTPALDQAAVRELTIEVVDELISGRVKLAVADAFDTPGNVPPLDPAAYPEELGVPVIFISPAPRSTVYEPISVVYRGHTYAAEGKRRGASSLSYPMLSYTIKFAPGDHFNDPTQAGGFFDRKRIVTITTFDDNTYLRQRLGYELWRRMDPDHIAERAYNAVMYVDGSFHGLYTIADHVDQNLFGAHGLDEAGNVYKSITHDANFDVVAANGSAKSELRLGWIKKEGLPLEGEPGAFADLEELTRFTATSPAATFAAELPTRIDVRDFRDWFVFATYTLAEDSAGKNAYLYHDPAVGPWRFVPWDLNHSFGQAWQTSRTGATAWNDFRGRNKIFARMMDDPGLGAALAGRYREMLGGPLAVDDVVALFDAMVVETQRVAERNQRKWGAAYRAFSRWSGRTDFLDHDAEVAYTRAWIRSRDAMLRGRYP
jgi:spore coat protein H